MSCDVILPALQMNICLAERAGVVHESIVMEEPPVQVPSALPDLSSQSAQSLCAADGTVIAFNQLAVVPELRGGAGCLAQQAAAAGPRCPGRVPRGERVARAMPAMALRKADSKSGRCPRCPEGEICCQGRPAHG